MALFSCVVVACGGGGGGGSNNSGSTGVTTPVDNSVGRVDVAPTAPITLQSGATATLSASAFTRDGRSVSSASFTWLSSNDAVASVSGGVITAKLVGTASITATSGSVSSSAVTVTVTPGAAAQLGVRTQPSGAASAVALTVQPVIEVRDAAGNLVSTASTAVTVAVASGGGTLAGTVTATAVAGIASYTDLAITGLVGARTLQFSATGLTAATSNSFTLTAGAASKLSIRTQPVAGTAYAVFPTPPVLEIQDAAGNLTASTATVTATIAAGGGTLSGASVNSASGVSTFSALTVLGTAGARTLTFSSAGLPAVTSVSFNVAVAPPAIIKLSSDISALSASLGSNPAATTVSVTNTGVFPLTNLRVQSVTYTPASPAGWLVTSFTAGTDAPASLRLTVTAASLAIGSYSAAVVLAGDGAAATKTLTVNLTVTPLGVNSFGTSANRVSILAPGATLTPGLQTTLNGAVSTPDPTVTYISRSTAIATVDASGRITAVAPGQGWIVAASTQSNNDSVLVIVPRNTGLVLRTDMTKYNYRIGDTITVKVIADTRGATLGAATVTFTWPVYIGSAGTFGSLAYIDAVAGASTMSPLFSVDNTLNVIRINANSTAGATGVVELATIRFRIIKSGLNTFYVNGVELLGIDLSDLLTTASLTQYPVLVP